MAQRTRFAVGLIAGLAVLTAAAYAQSASHAAAGIATRITLTAEPADRNGTTTFTATAIDADGAPVSGPIALTERGVSVAGAVLDAEGHAEIKLDPISTGIHTLRAVYSGDATHAASQSSSIAVPQAIAANDFGFTVSPAAVPAAGQPAIAPGDSSQVITATVTPGSTFTGFVSFSCAGTPPASGAPGGTALPLGVSCTFTPANVEVTSSSPVSDDLVILTQSGQIDFGSLNKSSAHSTAAPVALAVLLPGFALLGLLGRKRKFLNRAALLAMVGIVGLLGTTACNQRYHYLNHGPNRKPTPAGTYILVITAQTSNGVTAVTHTTNLTLTVN